MSNWTDDEIEIELLRATVKSFANDQLAPIAATIDSTNEFPLTLWPAMGEVGLLGITVAEEFGGSNMGYLAQTIALEELSRVSASVGLSYGAHANLCVNQIYLNGNEEQKKRYLPPLVNGTKIGALAMSEAEAGSDVFSMQLKAEADGDYYILQGNKMWCTNGPDADVLIVYAKTNKKITAFIVEKDTPGFSTGPKIDKLGMRGSNTSELIFNNCKIHKSQILGSYDQGSKVLMSGLNYERVVLAGGPLGIMQACLDLSLSYAKTRQQFQQPIANFQLIQAKLAHMYTNLQAARAFVYHVARNCNANTVSNKDAASVILFAAQHATQAALETIQILGGNGYSNEYPAGRLLRDAKLYEIGAGTSEIRCLIIGRELIKE